MQAGEDIASLLTRAIARHEAGRFAEAQELYAEVLRQDARQPDALNLMAVLAAQNGQVDEAIELIRAAIVEQPQNFHFRFNYGHILELAGRPQAAAVYREALTINPQHLPALINLGNLLLGADRANPERLGEAIDCFNRALTVEPNLIQAHEGLGMALQRRQDRDAALASFQRALTIDPGSVEANANLGTLLVEMGRAQEALPHLRQAVDAAPDRADLWINLAVGVKDGAGTDPAMLGDALAALGRALDLEPGNSRAIALRSVFLQATGRAEEGAAIVDPHRRVRLRRISNVPGFKSLGQFDAALVERLLNHPRLVQTPLGAVSGELRDDPDPAIQTLVSTAEAELDAAFAAQDSNDPYGPSEPPRWKLGLKANLINPGAREEPRIHPLGRMSGLYLLPAPDADGVLPAEATGRAVFGAVPSRFGGLDQELREIDALPGQLLVFPSYLWFSLQAFETGPGLVGLVFQAVAETA